MVQIFQMCVRNVFFFFFFSGILIFKILEKPTLVVLMNTETAIWVGNSFVSPGSALNRNFPSKSFSNKSFIINCPKQLKKRLKTNYTNYLQKRQSQQNGKSLD